MSLHNLGFSYFPGSQTLNLMFSTVTIIRKSVSLVISKGPNMAMQVKAKEIVLQQCRLMKQNARKSFTFKVCKKVAQNHNISANQTDLTDS